MSLRILTKYCIVNLNQLEIKIIMEAFKDFNPRRYDVKEETRILKRMPSKKESKKRLKRLRDQYKNPTREQYNFLLEEFQKYYEYTKTGRFFNAQINPYHFNRDSYGEDATVRLWDKDPRILVDVVKNYRKVESIEVKPKNLIENKSMMHIYKHHVDKLIKDLEDIEFAMNVHRIHEMGAD